MSHNPPLIMPRNPPIIMPHNPPLIMSHNPSLIMLHNPPLIMPRNPPLIMPRNPPLIMSHNPSLIMLHNPPLIMPRNPPIIMPHNQPVIVPHNPPLIIISRNIGDTMFLRSSSIAAALNKRHALCHGLEVVTSPETFPSLRGQHFYSFLPDMRGIVVPHNTMALFFIFTCIHLFIYIYVFK